MKTPVSESFSGKKRTPVQMFFGEFSDFFRNIFFSNRTSGRSMFINYIDPIGPWGPKPNNKNNNKYNQ